jgi:hypothetical protein
MKHEPFDHASTRAVRGLWRAVGALALVGAGISASDCLTGCTYVDNNTLVTQDRDSGAGAIGADGGGASSMTGGGSHTGGGKPPNDGGTGGAADASDPLGAHDGGRLPGDAGAGSTEAGPSQDAGICLDANWVMQGDKCCWALAGKNWTPPGIATSLVLSGQTTGTVDLGMSHGYSERIVISAPGAFKSYLFVQFNAVDAAPYMNAAFEPQINRGLIDTKHPEVAVWVVPQDACNDSLPPGGTLHLTYSVSYN